MNSNLRCLYEKNSLTKCHFLIKNVKRKYTCLTNSALKSNWTVTSCHIVWVNNTSGTVLASQIDARVCDRSTVSTAIIWQTSTCVKIGACLRTYATILTWVLLTSIHVRCLALHSTVTTFQNQFIFYKFYFTDVILIKVFWSFEILLKRKQNY